MILSYRSLVLALISFALPTVATAADPTICPIYPYGNFGGVTYYYAAKCDGTTAIAYISWAGNGSITTGCGHPSCFPAKRGKDGKAYKFAKAESKNFEADDDVVANGAPNYTEGEFAYGETFVADDLEHDIKKLVIDGETIKPFIAQTDDEKTLLKVYPFQITREDSVYPVKRGLVGVEIETGTHTHTAEIKHSKGKLRHFVIEVKNGIFMEGQLIRHKN